MSGWVTPSARDWKDSPGMATEGTNPDGSERSRTDQLPRQAQLTGWPTPSTMDNGNTGTAWMERRERVKESLGNGNGFGLILPMAAQLTGPVRLTATGEMRTGSSAAMESGGQLCPVLPLWLMGLPFEWIAAAPTQASRAPRSSGGSATRLLRRSRKRSSAQ